MCPPARLYFLRYSEGVIPVRALNCREAWARFFHPARLPITTIESFVSCKRHAIFATRILFSQAMGVVPTSFANARCNADGDKHNISANWAIVHG